MADRKDKPKSLLQMEKERFYDKLHVTVRQLDIIIWLAFGGLAITLIMIVLDALNVI